MIFLKLEAKAKQKGGNSETILMSVYFTKHYINHRLTQFYFMLQNQRFNENFILI